MTWTERHAWYGLAVVGLSVVTTIALVLVWGAKAVPIGFAPLGLLGLAIVVVRRGKGVVASDERDDAIRARAVTLAYSVFWLVFVIAAVLVTPVVYGTGGAVPVATVQTSVFGAFALFQAAYSIAVLVQYGRSGGHAD